MMKTYSTTIGPFDVKFTAWPASRGHRDRYGEPEEPDEPAGFEIDEVHCKGEDVTSYIDFDVLNELMETELSEEAESDAYDYADHLSEIEKDRRMGI